MKIKKIEVKNFKAVSDQKADFNGCSAIVTAGNDEGKTSFLRGLIDRMRGQTPSVILKEGEKKGFNYIELTDGSRIEWSFTGKTERFAFITKEGVKQTQGVIAAIGKRYFGTKFDIDKFLNSSGKVQTKELQKLVGIDLTELDEKYKTAYELRTVANKKVEELRAQKLIKLEEISQPDIEGLKKKKDALKEKADEAVRGNHLKNQELRVDFSNQKEALRIEINTFNSSQDIKEKRLGDGMFALGELQNISQSFESIGFDGLCDVFRDATLFMSTMPKNEKLRSYESEKLEVNESEYLNEIPDYSEVDKVDLELEKAYENQQLYYTYKNELNAYEIWVKTGKAAKENQIICDEKVKAIEAEKRKLISEAKIPADFDIKDDGIYYNGFPLTDNQISSSGKYIAALKLGSMVLGEIKTMHFDASFLDNSSLTKIQNWANENDFQLLIERPKLDGGEIEYQII